MPGMRPQPFRSIVRCRCEYLNLTAEIRFELAHAERFRLSTPPCNSGSYSAGSSVPDRWKGMLMKFLKTSLSLICVAGLLIAPTIGEAARKYDRRMPQHKGASATAQAKAKPYGAGMSEEQSLRALESEILRKLGSNIREDDYPEEARREGWSGTTRVDVLVSSNGQVKEASVQQSSGFSILDEKAVRIFERITLWWIPQRLRNREVTVNVPVGFYIRETKTPSIAVDMLESMLPEPLYIQTIERCSNSSGVQFEIAPLPASDPAVPDLPLVQESDLDSWVSARDLP